MVIAEVEDNIGTGIANLVNVFDPGTIILPGEVISNFHEFILEGIRRIVGRKGHACNRTSSVFLDELPWQVL